MTLKAEEATLEQQVYEFSEMLQSSLDQRNKEVVDKLGYMSIELVHKSTYDTQNGSFRSLKLKIDRQRPSLLNIKDKERSLKACFSDRLSLSGLSAGNNNRLSTCEDSAA